MDQLAVLQQLEKVAAIMRQGGLDPLTQLGRNFTKSLLRNYLTIKFDDLQIAAPVKFSALLDQVRAERNKSFMTRLFKQAVAPNSLVLDIGAGLGYYTLLALRQGADVQAFEPDARIFPQLVANAQRNHLIDFITPAAKAVSDRSGMARFFVHDDARRNGFFKCAGGQEVKVETVAVDDCVDPAAKLRAIKLDVAGAELLALRGMERTLARSGEVKLFIDYDPASPAREGSRPRELLKRLGQLGFAVSVIDEPNRSLVPADDKLEGCEKPVSLFCARD